MQLLDGVAEAGEQLRTGRRDVLADPEHGDDHVLGVELETDVVLLAHEHGDPVAGRSGAADVDRKPQRIPGEDARGLGDLPSEHVEAGDLADLRRSSFSDAIVSASSASPATASWRRAASRDAVRIALGLVDSTRVTERSIDPASSPRSLVGAEVQDRRLGHAAAELVDRVEDDVGSA